MTGKYLVLQGDRIERIAARLYGDINRYRELVQFNNLDYPYLDDHPAPYRAQGLRVLGIGDALYYPLEGIPSQATPSAVDLEAEAYGRDLHLIHGQIVLQGGTLGLIAGLDNLNDALQRRLNTPLGNLPAHPRSYGHNLGQYVGLTGTPLDAALMLTEAERCIRQDPRVEGLEIRLHQEGNRVTLEPLIHPQALDASTGLP